MEEEYVSCPKKGLNPVSECSGCEHYSGISSFLDYREINCSYSNPKFLKYKIKNQDGNVKKYVWRAW